MTHAITHHPTADMLFKYAAGTLPEAFNLAIATHISLCDQCRAEVESYNMIGGGILDAMASPVSATSFEETLARIDKSPPARLPARSEPHGLFPAPLQDYAGADLSAVNWRPVGLGVRQAILPTSETASARLLHIPAGRAMPDHSHRGTELTLVLQGAVLDGDKTCARGDLEINDASVHHTPIADTKEDCICLAVTDAPLVFRGLIPRLLQPFLRI